MPPLFAPRKRVRKSVQTVCAAAVLLLAVAVRGAFAAYPERPVRLIVPFPAGNSLDVRARQLMTHLPALLGQQIIVDNRGGASGIIAMELAAKASPDGYTILFANSTQLAINPAMSRSLPYDVFKDYLPVSLLGKVPSLVVISNVVPAKSLKDLIALAKAKPGQLNFASQGNGSTGHLAGELFMRLTGTRLTHVPYKVYSQILTDLFSGQVALIIGGPPVLLPHLQAGKLRALAINTPKRIWSLPEVPTFDEAGVPGFWVAPWYGVLVPAGTSARIIATLNGAFNQTLKASDVVEISRNDGQTLVGSTPAEFAAFIKGEYARCQQLVKEAGIRLD
jgi:tripartite-type tricarboxylate transporter receptor subunit TctC